MRRLSKISVTFNTNKGDGSCNCKVVILIEKKYHLTISMSVCQKLKKNSSKLLTVRNQKVPCDTGNWSKKKSFFPVQISLFFLSVWQAIICQQAHIWWLLSQNIKQSNICGKQTKCKKYLNFRKSGLTQKVFFCMIICEKLYFAYIIIWKPL